MKWEEVKTMEDYKKYARANAKNWYQKNKKYKKAKQRAYYRGETLTKEQFYSTSQQEQE